MAIGYRGLRYRITAVTTASITLERLTDTGAADLGWPGFSDITLDDVLITLDASSQEGGFAGPFAACPKGELTSTIEWDVFFPGGLTSINKYGNNSNQSVTVNMQYRDADIAGAWTEITKVYTDANYPSGKHVIYKDNIVQFVNAVTKSL